MGALDNPAPGALARLFGFLFLAPSPDVGRVAVGGDGLAHLGRIVARVEAQVLLGPGGFPRLPGLLNGGGLALQGALQEFHVVPVGPVEHEPDGDALGLGLPAALDPALGPVRGVGAGFFPPRAALCVASRRAKSIPNPGQSRRRSRAGLRPRGGRRRPLRPTAGSGYGPWSP